MELEFSVSFVFDLPSLFKCPHNICLSESDYSWVLRFCFLLETLPFVLICVYHMYINQDTVDYTTTTNEQVPQTQMHVATEANFSPTLLSLELWFVLVL